jgi:hypothetical protein
MVTVPVYNPYSPRPGESFAWGPMTTAAETRCEDGWLFERYGLAAWKRLRPCPGCRECQDA